MPPRKRTKEEYIYTHTYTSQTNKYEHKDMNIFRNISPSLSPSAAQKHAFSLAGFIDLPKALICRFSTLWALSFSLSCPLFYLRDDEALPYELLSCSPLSFFFIFLLFSCLVRHDIVGWQNGNGVAKFDIRYCILYIVQLSSKYKKVYYSEILLIKIWQAEYKTIKTV